MAIYSVGRRRVIIALLLTSALLLTLDLRGNPVIDTVRDAFTRVMDPVESAAEVVTNPIEQAWNGVTNYDDLERENQALQDEIDRLVGSQASAEASLIEFQELQALFNLPSLSGIETEVAKVVGRSSNNLDQVIEINKGSANSITIGMPVVNQAGLIGNVTSVTPTTAKVKLITDSRYTVAAKVLAGTEPAATVATTPSGLTEDEVLDAATTTTAPPAVNPDTTLPGTPAAAPGNASPVTTTIPGEEAPESTTTTTTVEEEEEAAPTATTTTTTSTTVPSPTVEKEFGALEGRGRGLLPQLRFLQDNPSLAVLEVGDLVETAGGSESLAPPGIPIGRVVNRADRSGSSGPLLDVEPHADLDQLGFVRVVLYKPLSEVEQ